VPLKSWPAIDIVALSSPGPDRALADFLAAFLDDFSPTAIVELPAEPDSAFGWRVFFGSAEARTAAADALEASPEWRTRVSVAPVDVPDEQWAERSQADLESVAVDRVIVAPPWDLPRARTASAATGRAGSNAPIIIEIEPSMGFGTGHHESTRLCLRALQAIALDGRRAIDLGTGSGVLAIAAVLLGCTRAIAIDDDPDAIDAARDNVHRNGVQDRVELRLASLSQGLTGLRPRPPGEADRADVVVGNLTGGLLRRYAEQVASFITPGGILILGGFTRDERLAVLHAFGRFSNVGEHDENGWAALTLRRGQT
jgi:ribosomal protein L11 methyltransferase